MTVFANGRSILHKGDGRVQTCPIPDMCKTPSPGGPVPLPYINVASDGDLAKGAKKVKVEGNMPGIEGAELSMSSGDEAGTAGGGITSNKIKGKLTWAACSSDVKFEGKGVIRFLEICLHNGNNSNTGGNANLGTPSPGLAYGDDAPCPICGKAGGHPIPSTASTEAEANATYSKLPHGRKPNNPNRNEGYMYGVLEATDGSGKRFLKANSGKNVNGLSPTLDLKSMMANQNSTFTTPGGRRYQVRPAQTDTTAGPGNCAAPKLIYEALQAGLTPVALTEFWVGPAGKYGDGDHTQSCDTCKRILPAMLCPEPPDPNDPTKVYMVDQPLP